MIQLVGKKFFNIMIEFEVKYEIPGVKNYLYTKDHLYVMVYVSKEKVIQIF